MNKFLTSAAAVALLVGAAGTARAEDSVSVNGITFYGTIDVGVAYDTHGVPNATNGSVSSYSLIQKQSNHANFGVTENGLSQSKLGIKGAEDIGAGWTGIFKLEAGISPAGGSLTDGPKTLIANNGYTVVGSSAHPTAYNGWNSAGADSGQAGQIFSRAAYVGLTNDQYGTLTFGRQTTLQTDLIGSYDPLYGSYAYALIGFSGTPSGSGATEDARWNNAIKYLYSYGPVRVAGMYSPSGTISARNDSGLGADIGLDYAGLSIDGAYIHKKDEVSASALSAANEVTALADNLSVSNTLNGSVFDSTSFSIGAKYKVDTALTLLAGVEYIEEKNPSSPLVNGTVDMGGYTLLVNNASLPAEKDLTYVWGGARYLATAKLELGIGYYYLHQNDFSGANAADIKLCAIGPTQAGTCSGDEHVASFLADYHVTKKFDIYGGVMYSHVLGSQANGFVHSNNIAPSTGIRYSF